MAFSALSWTVLLYIGIAYFALDHLRSVIATRQFRAFERKNGSSRPVFSSAKLPWSLDRVYAVVKASREGLDLFDDFLLPRFQKLKTWTFEGFAIFNQPYITTAEPKNVQAAFATHFKDFATGPTRAGQFGALLGHKGVFTLDGEKWARGRKMVRPVFNRERVNNLEETGRASEILIDLLPKNEHGKWTEAVDLMPYFYRFTLDTATGFLFGKSVESQSAAAGKVIEKDSEELGHIAAAEGFSEAFRIAQEWLSYRIRLQGLYFLVDGLKWRRAVKTVRSFVNHYVQQALEQVERVDEEMEDGKEKEYSFLSELIKETRDPIELRDHILGLLLAGRDTTAILLSWTFAELAQHPQLYADLRTSIIDTFGSNSKTPLTFANLKSNHTIQNLLNESLRLHPVVPLNNRICIKDTILPVGGGFSGTEPIAVQKGTLVNFVVYQMHRRKDIWGEDADEFKPDRWEGRKIGWEFVPFSGGARICLGQQYALTEASYLLVRFVQCFDRIESMGEAEGGRLRKGFGLAMFPADGVRVRLRRAE
ncbi:cytochrome P450 alkane hydroxylase-like protein [Venturia nashicola]|uniref:Cytochrome P450 alkane hydroxylase-like protein n=1 Tax=Venturia nashicola TaxID=86259 RepID=A0A4Z1NUG4_9PEZI|nr:cytochrome P450 alkane hydroxylase-like protein [Venturia nashicola]